MAKKTINISKDGFVIYRDMLDTCLSSLSTDAERGVLIRIVNEFVNNRPIPPNTPKHIVAYFNCLKIGILKSEEKYIQRKATLKKYYDAKKAENQKSAENAHGNGNGSCTSNGDGNGNGNGTCNGDGNGNGNSENLYKNSLSAKGNKVKYTEAEVAAILEEREIFFKKNDLKAFFMLNSTTYNWKYDPYSAALVYIKHHPDALKKGGEDTGDAPQNAAAPPKDLKAAEKAYINIAQANAAKWWQELQETIRAAITPEQLPLLEKIKPVSGMPRGYSLKEMDLYVPDFETYQFATGEDSPVEKALKDFRVSSIRYRMPAEVEALVAQRRKEAMERFKKRRAA